MVVPSCNPLDVLQLHLGRHIAVSTLPSAQLPINAIAECEANTAALSYRRVTSFFAITRVWLVPQDTDSTPSPNDSILVGLAMFLVLPWPSCPSIPLPQEYKNPSEMAHMWKGPHSILLT